MEKKICFIGAGNMAEAIIRGVLRSSLVAPQNILVTDTRSERLDYFRKNFDVAAAQSNHSAVELSDIVVLAVKPQSGTEALEQISASVNPSKLIVSILSGTTTATIESKLKLGARIVRAMPNTPALVGAGATAIAAGTNASKEDLETAKALFDAVGLTVVVSESLLDAVTGLSGSGPAYIFVMLEAMADAGVKMGLPRSTAQLLAAQTIFGSAKLQIETAAHPAQLKDQVASPGGTTISGLHALEVGAFRAAIMNAVEAATLRAKEQGKASGS